jgi:F-type H+-transporting ATPase subunit a
MTGIHVALAPERLGALWGLPITNTLVMSWVVVVLLAVLAFSVGGRVKLVPSRIQTLFEWIVEFVYDYIAEVLGSRQRARALFPFLMTIFLFIATANLIEFTPGIGSFGFWHADEFTPLLRSVNTDLNVTLALAILAVIVIEIAGITALGLRHYASKFINFSSPLKFVVGLIELVSEASRLVSFSFRLFGNVFAGEVLLIVATYFVPYVLPSFLMTFELFVGFVQAAVFALLTLFFLKLAMIEASH